MSSKDHNILRHIVDYCEQIQATRREYGNDRIRFLENATCHNAVCLCLMQIGELVSVLSDDFKNENPQIQWRDMKLLRNIVAHRYGEIDYDIIWEICENDIPDLIDFCEATTK